MGANITFCTGRRNSLRNRRIPPIVRMKSRRWGRCPRRILSLRPSPELILYIHPNRHRTGADRENRPCEPSLSMLMHQLPLARGPLLLLLLNPPHIPPHPPPAPHNRHSQTPHHDPRAHRRRRIHIPSPLLRRPKRILHHGMETRFPKKKRRRPPNIREKLVVQTPRAKTAYRNRLQHRRHDEIRRHHSRDDLLVERFAFQQGEELAGRAAGGFDPAGQGYPGEESEVEAEKTEREWPG